MRKILGIFIVVCTFIMSTMTGFAEIQFSDVADSHWAKPYILNMASKNIIKGEIDDKTLKIKFRPDDNVTYVESIQMIYNILRETNNVDKTIDIADTKALLSSAGIPTWAHEAVGYALKKQILMGGDLLAFTSGNKQVPAKKQDIAIFIGKALNKKTEAFPTKIYSFVDAETIKSAAVPYVDLLVRENIVKGDSKNRFNPNSNVTRAVMATMCSNTYDVVKDIQIIDKPSETKLPEPPKEEPKEEVLKVIYVAEDIDRIVVSNSKDIEQVHSTKSAKFYKNSKSIELDHIKADDEVILEFDHNNRLIKIEVINGLIEYEGKVDSVEDMGDYHKLVTRNKDNLVIKKEFKIYDDTDIYIGNNKVSVGKINENEYIYIEYKGDKIVKIDLLGSGKKVEMDGILVSEVQFKGYPVLKFKINTGDILEYEIDGDADIERDDHNADLDELKKGDIVTVEIYKNKIEEINATSIKEDGEDEGIIKELILGDPSKITIRNEDKEIVTYEVSKDVRVRIDDERDKHFGDLRLNYYVELDIESGEVTKIEAEQGYQNENITGEVTKVYERYDRLSVKYYVEKENKYEDISIVVTDDTKIIKENGSNNGDIDDIEEDDKVFIDGYEDDGLFVANKIVILGSN